MNIVNNVNAFICIFLFQESLKKFREEAGKLDKSEALQKAREKYVSHHIFFFFFFKHLYSGVSIYTTRSVTGIKVVP